MTIPVSLSGTAAPHVVRLVAAVNPTTNALSLSYDGQELEDDESLLIDVDIDSGEDPSRVIVRFQIDHLALWTIAATPKTRASGAWDAATGHVFDEGPGTTNDQWMPVDVSAEQSSGAKAKTKKIHIKVKTTTSQPLR